MTRLYPRLPAVLVRIRRLGRYPARHVLLEVTPHQLGVRVARIVRLDINVWTQLPIQWHVGTGITHRYHPFRAQYALLAASVHLGLAHQSHARPVSMRLLEAHHALPVLRDTTVQRQPSRRRAHLDSTQLAAPRLVPSAPLGPVAPIQQSIQ